MNNGESLSDGGATYSWWKRIDDRGMHDGGEASRHEAPDDRSWGPHQSDRWTPLPDLETVYRQLDSLYADPRHPPPVSEIDKLCAGHRTALFDWCAATFRFLLVTEELALGLARHLAEIGARRCLEVGAGRGELALALSVAGLDCAAADDFSWATRPRATNGIYAPHVMRMSNEKALDSLKPDTVLCAWMPNHEDWTQSFRSAPSVLRYVLLGTGPGGQTGAASVWADHAGWRRQDLADLEAHARCRIDALLGTPFARLHTRITMWDRDL